MTVTEIATEIHTEIGSPTSPTISSIEYWLRGKVGTINNLLFEDFVLSSNEIVDGDGAAISINAASVIKKLYLIYYYDFQIRANLNAISTDTVLEVNDDGSSVKRINRNEVSKTLATLKKQESDEFDQLVNAYRIREASPHQVVGDDTTQGDYGHDVIVTRLRVI